MNMANANPGCGVVADLIPFTALLQGLLKKVLGHSLPQVYSAQVRAGTDELTLQVTLSGQNSVRVNSSLEHFYCSTNEQDSE
jgi:hypothetical protein